MRVLADSSALAKRYLDEPGSETVQRILRDATALGISIVCIPEVVSSLSRRRRERKLSRDAYATVKAAFLEDVRDCEVVNVTDDVLRRAIDALERHPLRAMDALHVGSAIAWGADRFASADKAQLRAAALMGLGIVEV